jgi:hypothetical protein
MKKYLLLMILFFIGLIGSGIQPHELFYLDTGSIPGDYRDGGTGVDL